MFLVKAMGTYNHLVCKQELNHVLNFTFVTFDKVRKEILTLDSSKATMHVDKLADILKTGIKVYLNLITETISKSFSDE